MAVLIANAKRCFDGVDSECDISRAETCTSGWTA